MVAAGLEVPELGSTCGVHRVKVAIVAPDVEDAIGDRRRGRDIVAGLEAHSRGIVVGATRVRHGDDASLEVRALCRDRQMQIVSKGSDPASTRKMIADERHTLKQLHFAISRRLLVEAILARGRGVGS